MKRPSSKAHGKATRSFPFENKKIDFAKFKSHPTVTEIAKLTRPGVGTTVPFGVPIETLSPIKTVGLGNTWIKLVTPYGFYPRLPYVPPMPPLATFVEDGYVEVAFDPTAYGITSVATYGITFNIETYNGAATFRLVGPGAANVSTHTLNGRRTVELIVRDLPAGRFAIGRLEWMSGVAGWTWYSSVFKFPDIVVGPE
jgi:hypothetical protein